MSDESNTPQITEKEYHRAWKEETDPDLSCLRNIAYEIAVLKNSSRSSRGKVDAACHRASLHVDCKTKKCNEHFLCHTKFQDITITCVESNVMKDARKKVYDDTVQKILLPYLRINQTSSGERELEASLKPFSTHHPEHSHDQSESEKKTCDPFEKSVKSPNEESDIPISLFTVDNTKLTKKYSSEGMSLDAYRDPTESPPEWQLRQQFLALNRDSLHQDRLISLSKCFVNMYFSGCLYPPAVMREIRERSHGILDKKEKQEKGLRLENFKNSFVKASDDNEPKKSTHNNNSNDKLSSRRKTGDEVKVERLGKNGSKGLPNNDFREEVGPSLKKRKSDMIEKKSNFEPDETLPSKRKQKKKDSENMDLESPGKPLKDLILVQNVAALSAHQILNESTGFNRMSMRFHFEHDTSSQPALSTCSVVIENQVVASATGENKTVCKTEACDIALSKIRKLCWCIKVKRENDAETIIARKYFSCDNSKGYKVPAAKGLVSKMMQKMGWTGGSLGKDGSGALEPVSFSFSQSQSQSLGMGHEGLGFESTEDFDRAKVTEFLENYASNSDNTRDVAFAEDFSKTERNFIHKQCVKLHLRSKSRSRGQERRLIVGRKWTPTTLFNHIQESGGETEKYVLIAPNTNTDTYLDQPSLEDGDVSGEDNDTDPDSHVSDKVEIVDLMK